MHYNVGLVLLAELISCDLLMGSKVSTSILTGLLKRLGVLEVQNIPKESMHSCDWLNFKCKSCDCISDDMQCI